MCRIALCLLLLFVPSTFVLADEPVTPPQVAVPAEPVFVDKPCKQFVVVYHEDKLAETIAALKKLKVKIKLASEHDFFITCEGPLSAKLQAKLAKVKVIKFFEPDVELIVD